MLRHLKHVVTLFICVFFFVAVVLAYDQFRVAVPRPVVSVPPKLFCFSNKVLTKFDYLLL